VGGGRLYHRLIPVFVGLVVGQVFASTIVWRVFDLFMPESWRAAAQLGWYL
jgi:hypothetical protein